ncbi:MAG: porin family protein [Nitratireductor sp.]|uniref:outer membrane protein n=1 Tax=Nitratireductor sp. TaxID=1872084 RepID=UPI002637EC2C|nr:outer membrane protein [Nitratireductor sp.]MCV0348640.1 porin family protein [Nitratireductor sp.]
MKAHKNVILSAAAAVGFVAVAGVANAADAVIEQPPAPPAAPVISTPINNWEGGYAGIALGYGFSGETSANQPVVGNDIGTDGFVGNGFAGWNFQSGSFVYGVEGDVGYNGMKGTNAGVESKGGVDGTLRARLGVAATDNILIYGTAGGAAERLKVSDAAGSDTNTMLGWTAGAGVDAKLTERVFGRVEYRYTKFGSETFNTGSGAQDVSDSSNKVMFGLGMQF